MSSPNQNAEDSDENKEEKKRPEDEISFIMQVKYALTTAKSENKILIVLCESSQNIEYIDIWNHTKVVEAVQKHAVCLLIIEDSLPCKQFTALYPIIAFPTMYCINPQNGQVLQCTYKAQITLHSVLDSITKSMQMMEQQTNEAMARIQLQIREITSAQNPSHNNNNPIISIQEMDPRSQDSQISSSPQNSHETPTKKKKSSVITKLEQIRKKALSQKVKSPTNSEQILHPKTSTKLTENKSSKPMNQKTAPSKLNNYNFDEAKLDPIAYMEITRRNKLRKRKKKVDAKLNVKPKKVAKKQTKEDDIVASTPILSAVQKGSWKIDGAQKKARLAFRINNEMDIEQYFNYDDTLMDVMMYIMTETGVNDFVFVSQYPPIDIDSIYLDQKMSKQMGLFTKHTDEKSNESMYDEIQSKLQKTLYELNMVPSCRVFIQPKFKGHKRANTNWSDNKVVKCGYLIIDLILDLIQIIAHYGYSGLYFVLCLLWEIVNMPLKMLGITQSEDLAHSNESVNAQQNINKPQRKSKLRPYKKNKRLQGKRSGIQRLQHLENDEDRNKLNNGNSTMYGGDENQ